MAQLFREGTEMGLLGLHASTHHIYATDGGKALRCRVGRSRESRTSLWVETDASYLALEHMDGILQRPSSSSQIRQIIL